LLSLIKVTASLLPEGVHWAAAWLALRRQIAFKASTSARLKVASDRHHLRKSVSVVMHSRAMEAKLNQRQRGEAVARRAPKSIPLKMTDSESPLRGHEDGMDELLKVMREDEHFDEPCNALFSRYKAEALDKLEGMLETKVSSGGKQSGSFSEADGIGKEVKQIVVVEEEGKAREEQGKARVQLAVDVPCKSLSSYNLTPSMIKRDKEKLGSMIVKTLEQGGTDQKVIAEIKRLIGWKEKAGDEARSTVTIPTKRKVIEEASNAQESSKDESSIYGLADSSGGSKSSSSEEAQQPSKAAKVSLNAPSSVNTFREQVNFEATLPNGLFTYVRPHCKTPNPLDPAFPFMGRI
jgi:hypothetical protein